MLMLHCWCKPLGLYHIGTCWSVFQLPAPSSVYLRGLPLVTWAIHPLANDRSALVLENPSSLAAWCVGSMLVSLLPQLGQALITRSENCLDNSLSFSSPVSLWHCLYFPGSRSKQNTWILIHVSKSGRLLGEAKWEEKIHKIPFNDTEEHVCLYLEYTSSSFSPFIHLITLECFLRTKWELLSSWDEKVDIICDSK